MYTRAFCSKQFKRLADDSFPKLKLGPCSTKCYLCLCMMNLELRKEKKTFKQAKLY